MIKLRAVEKDGTGEAPVQQPPLPPPPPPSPPPPPPPTIPTTSWSKSFFPRKIGKHKMFTCE